MLLFQEQLHLQAQKMECSVNASEWFGILAPLQGSGVLTWESVFGLAKDGGRKLSSFTWLLLKFLCPVLCQDKLVVWTAESFLFEIIQELHSWTIWCTRGWLQRLWAGVGGWHLPAVAPSSRFPTCARRTAPPELLVPWHQGAHLQEQSSLWCLLQSANPSQQRALPRLTSVFFLGRERQKKSRWLSVG